MSKSAATHAVSDLDIARSITWRYVTALVLIAALSSAAWVSLSMVISNQKSTAALVNVSGRQRMLSQRAALFANLLVAANEAERTHLRVRLRDTIELMDRSHHALTSGNEDMGLPESMSDTVHRMYFDGPDALNIQVEDYFAAINALLSLSDAALTPDSAPLHYINQRAPDHLLKSLNAMVDQYQLEGEQSVGFLQKAETTLWGITLLLLIMEALLIFRPLSAHVKSIIGRLQRAGEELEAQAYQLEIIVEERTAELKSRGDELLESREQLRQLAFYDAITELPNRLLFNDRLSQTMAASKRNQHHGALMFLDLDNFKALNDKHGHDVGDLLLVEVAQRLKGCIRGMDTVARFGGDEFVVMLVELSANQIEAARQARTIAKKLLDVLSVPYLLKPELSGAFAAYIEHRCTASIGVVLFIGNETPQEEILKRADMAMYKAKKRGGNRIVMNSRGAMPTNKKTIGRATSSSAPEKT